MHRSWRYILQNTNYSPFISNFIAMATKVGRGKILLAVSIAQPRKPPIDAKISQKSLAEATRKRPSKIWMALLDWPSPKTIPQNQKLRLDLIHSQSYDRLKNCLIFPIGAIVIFWINTLGINFKFFNPQKAYPCARPHCLSHRVQKSAKGSDL